MVKKRRNFNLPGPENNRKVRKFNRFSGADAYIQQNKTLHSLRIRVTWRLTRLLAMRNDLKNSKIFQNGTVQLRFGCGYFFNLLKFSTVYDTNNAFVVIRHAC